ncbi:hypothetical protein N7449_011684 [Penicillium cf. viridicatum]|uniref:Uncharacterized protein n=1 Tax=Penicillium cf. viridicatum TaxID=2972119 RepID=A0A9W9LYP3_9EURO|nr:hypothetical protein N7449_011684 [Penicillium cf. viridicatum]
MSYKFKPKLRLHTQFQLFISMSSKRFGASNLSGTVNSDRLEECHRRSITANTGNRETASLFCSYVSTLMTRCRRRPNGGIGKPSFSIIFLINAAASANIRRSESSSIGVSYKAYIASSAHSLYPAAQQCPRTRQRSAIRASQARSKSRVEISAVPYLI